MTREPNYHEQRILDELVELSAVAPRAANETSRDFLLRTVRATIRSLMDPPHDVLDAGRAAAKTTPAVMTKAWNAMLDEISPAGD